MGLAELVQYNLGVTAPEDTINDYPFLDAYDHNNDGDITDAGEFVCTSSSITTCPHDFELVDLFLDLLSEGYDLTNAVNLANNGPPTPDADDLEEAILDEGGNQEDQITTGIFNCIESRISVTISSIDSPVQASSTHSSQEPKTSDQNIGQQAQQPIQQQNIQQKVPTILQNNDKRSSISQEQMHQQQIVKLKQFLASVR